ncbi:hypothetical protein C2845_PM14G09740 [Panicum miliaceum]|uniref:Uncharacterized protein n=1 Tax=Panicum miliaceum TaxID=4540 RepID=A0A3L6PSZ7_PANMI|nr:hypothetical protein C2845_PM14G09740 [Panicum miliaceum]
MKVEHVPSRKKFARGQAVSHADRVGSASSYRVGSGWLLGRHKDDSDGCSLATPFVRFFIETACDKEHAKCLPNNTERHQNATACLGVGPKIRKVMRISLNKEQKKNVARNHSEINAKAKLRNMARLYDNKATTKLGKACAKWFHRNGIPGTKADCPYFRRTMELTQQLGASALVPTGAEIDGASLDASEEED